ncbi:MAG: dihydropteroate synthase [Gemmatimonadaceae bacterium]
MTRTAWHVRDRVLALDRPLVMGILNVTPDSFSDGGRFLSADAAIRRGLQMVDDGADIVDIGGESTRPQGATPVSVEQELRRVIPVIEGIVCERASVVISVDTVKSDVARAAVQAGARIVNDVSGLRLDPKIAGVCAEHGAGLVLMHSRGAVSDMGTYEHALYDDVVTEVLSELRERVAVARSAGLRDEQIAVDPGIGFAKKSNHSLAVLAALPRLAAWGLPVLVGVSRKRFIGDLVPAAREPASRLHGTVGANVAALALGARIFRVHDVRENREALDVAWEVIGRR